MMTAALFILMGVVARVASQDSDLLAHQSQLSSFAEEPISASGQRVAGPEVVLSVNYERGALDRISLAQYSKNSRWLPTVPARTQLCQDLCHAGLGGEGCGPSCLGMVPVGLQAALHDPQPTTDVIDYNTTSYGVPRMSVCPSLCINNLGDPLCGCSTQEFPDQFTPDWNNVCDAFCSADRYRLRGCPECSTSSTVPSSAAVALARLRVLDTAAGWKAWCGVQCPQGQGGAACNCDRAPFV